MKKISLLVLVCMIFSLCFTSCSVLLAKDNTPEHTHSYATEWSFDATNHYNVCSCGSQSNVAKHADDNNDGACDVCAIILDNTHVFDDEWTTDATNHWHAALCGHDVVDAKAPHTADDLGNCTVCGVKVSSPVVETLADALELADLTAYLVKNGFVDSDFSYEGEYGTEHSYNYTWYSFAENYLHLYETGDRKNTYVSLVDGEVFALSIDGYGNVFVDEEATEDYLNGPAFLASFFEDYETTYYGVNDLVAGLYELGLQNTNGDFAEVKDANAYAFSYLYFSDGYLYSVEVAFTVDSELYFIDNVDICINKYEETSSTYDYDLWDYVDVINYTVVTEGESTVYTLNEDAVAYTTQVFAISQSVETKLENTPEEVLLLTYSLVDENGDAIDFENGISMAIGSYEIYFDDLVPTTALLDVANIQVSFTDSDGFEVWTCYGGYDSGKIVLSAYNVGTYIANITINDDVYTLPMTVTYATPETIAPGVFNENWGEFEEVEDKSIFAGNSFILGGVVESGCTPGFVAELVGDNAANATLTATVVSNWDGDLDAYEFTSATPGTYTVKITSTADENVSCELTVTVNESVQVSTIITGTYVTVGSPVTMTVIFTPTDSASGTALVSADHPRNGIVTDTFTYTIIDNVFTATLVDGGSAYFQNIYVDADMNVVLIADFWDYVLVPYTTSGDGDAVEVTGAPDAFGDIPLLDNETITYVTTVDAYGFAYFQLQYDGTAYQVTITHDGGDDIFCYAGSPKAPTMVNNGGYTTIDSISTSTVIFFESMNEYDDIDVTFTLTFTEI